MRKMIFQFLKKQKDAIFFSVEYHVYWLLKSVCFEIFGDRKYGLFFSQKVDAKMIFTDYWKVLVLNFSEMENTVFYWTKRLMGRWYLLGLFELSMIFQALENMFFLCSARCKFSSGFQVIFSGQKICYIHSTGLPCSISNCLCFEL